MEKRETKISLDELIEILAAPFLAGFGKKMSKRVIPFSKFKPILNAIWPLVITKKEWQKTCEVLKEE